MLLLLFAAFAASVFVVVDGAFTAAITCVVIFIAGVACVVFVSAAVIFTDVTVVVPICYIISYHCGRFCQ